VDLFINFLGGSITGSQAPAHVINTAGQILAAIDKKWLYARVDGTDTRAGFQLMELELIEPSLYLYTQAEAPKRFAEAIIKKLS
jgi:hypothetical protein